MTGMEAFVLIIIAGALLVAWSCSEQVKDEQRKRVKAEAERDALREELDERR